MPEFTSHRPGSICYVELATDNTEAARRFYCDLFGWQIRDEDMGPNGVYTQYLLDEKVTAAMYKLIPEQVSQGVPPHWDTYFAVEDCDASTNLAVDIGGKLVAGPMDVADYGRLSVLADPAGAVFCIWEVKTKIGLELRDDVNTVCWTELMTTDPSAAKAFYGRLFKWRATAMDMGEAGEYTLMGAEGETPDVGMMGIDEKMGPIPPHWASYFLVDDCNTAEKRALGLGAKSVVPLTPIPGQGFFCLLADPSGAVFGLYNSLAQE